VIGYFGVAVAARSEAAEVGAVEASETVMAEREVTAPTEKVSSADEKQQSGNQCVRDDRHPCKTFRPRNPAILP
jgi:hypothetical protein